MGQFLDYDDYSLRPSLFRERNQHQHDQQQQQQHDDHQMKRKKKELLLEDDGYFTDDYLPDKDDLMSPKSVPLSKKDYLYHLYNMPYPDLERLNYMYEIGKRSSNEGYPVTPALDLQNMDQIHGVGRKTIMSSPTEQFYAAVDSIKKKKKSLYADGSSPDLQKLKNYLTSAAGMYWKQETPPRDPMIRKKRDTKTAATGVNRATTKTPVGSSVPGTKTNISSSGENPESLHATQLAYTIPARYDAHQVTDRRYSHLHL